MKARRWIALAALPVAVAALYGLDLWLNHVREVASREFRPALFIWMTPAINLLYAAIVLGLFLAAMRSRQRWIGVAYAITGGLILTYPVLRLLGRLPLWIRRLFPYTTTLLDLNRGLFQIGAFVLAIGVWLLVRKSPMVDTGDKARGQP